ncbi:MAG: hypothetical protein IJ662_13445 [Clostridia bacterium]|nr:hypothetical protein [Clostridia bacterium]
MKKAILLMALLLALVLLAGCAASEGTQFPDAETAFQRDPMSLAADEDDEEEFDWAEDDEDDAIDWDEYDPASEEDDGAVYVEGLVYDDMGNSVYAGATPIPLNPIDMPTATPRPELTFTYGQVDIPTLGLSFEAPAGWTVDASAGDTVVITDPTTYDNFNASMTISITPVASTYKLNDVKTSVRDKLKEIGQYNYSVWTTTSLSERTLLKKDGYYANYRGEYYDGTVVRGRVMIALLDGNRIITLHMAAPGWYNDSYMKVVAHFRETAKMQ